MTTRLSSPIEKLKNHYQVVVVGSGYGGGIAASRLARSGQQVCLLERGREIQPGEYPDTELEALEEIQIHSADGHVGSQLGMFDLNVHKDINAVVGCGLGGTSLINANVALRAVPRVWEDPRWPAQVRADVPGLLEEGYQAAEAMLRPTPYPDGYPALAKLEALKVGAAAIGAAKSFYRPPINVTFADGPSPSGVPQKACTCCGDCVSGCNYGAKNTTLMNYLPDAWNFGAEIYTRVSVQYLERKDDKWVVHYMLPGEGRERFSAPDLFLTADLVVLSAGTLGSTEILLRSRAKGLQVSDQVGNHFSGNGDVLAFAFDCDRPIHGIGWGTRKPGVLPPVGPCITGIIDLRDVADVAQGFVIEEGSIPGALGPLLPVSFSLLADLAAAGPDRSPSHHLLGERLTRLKSLVEGPYRGAVDRTQTFLVMAHDGSEGQLSLVDDRLQISWPGVGKEPIFKTVNDRLAQVSVGLGGTFIKDPIWSKPFGESLVSVHPLGGCPMAEDAAAGVVNHKGQVFSSAAGDAAYDSLYVTDGSIVPFSLGVNPLLTISALSERAMTILARERGWKVDLTLPSQPRQVAAAAAVAGIRFTETMRGFFSTVVKDDYEAAAKQGKEADSAMEFTLTIQADDLNAMIDTPGHAAWIVGTVSSAALSAEPLTVVQGTFNLFVENPTEVSVRNMVYHLQLASEEGRSFFFEGFKKVDPSSMLELWPQTTTLYVTVHEGKDLAGPVLGKGILHIEPADFARQMTTFKITGDVDAKQQIEGAVRFGTFFSGVLYDAYGGILVPDKYFNPDAPARKKRPLRVGAPTLHPFKTSDGVELLLTRYQGGDKGPVLLVHGAGVSSRIFSTDLPETNLLEFLYAHGYDVWLFDYRCSIELEASKQQSNGDQVATIDHPEAVALVRQLTGAKTIQALVHCYGSNTFFMAMLAGLEGVRSIACSQVAANLISPLPTRIKSGLHLPNLLERLGINSLTAYVDSHEDWKSRIYDEVLRLNPLPETEQKCYSAVCHRITFMYSLLYQHQQLNELIHDNLHELFGVGNIATFEHLALMVDKQQVVAHDGQDVYMPHLDRLALPIRFVQGAENQCYLPASTKTTYDLLAARNGEHFYSRHVVPGYGHIDCIFGKDAARDVYPLFLEHLEQT
jgi:cholesterol oxidase